MSNVNTVRAVGVIVVLMMQQAALAFGPDWDEVVDAGPVPISAQRIFGSGRINSISGSLQLAAVAGDDGSDRQDMYLIHIDQPTVLNFSASTDPTLGGSANFDTRLWLFDAQGFGLLANDNAARAVMQSTLPDASTDGTGIVITEPGLYFLAVSGANVDALGDESGNPIFDFSSPTEISGPDGSAGDEAVGAWSDNDVEGEYVIVLTGVAFVTPGDLNGDGDVNGVDQALFCAAVGAAPGSEQFLYAADLNADGMIDHLDVQLFTAILPTCPGDVVTSATFSPPADGVTDGSDLAFLLGAWGAQPSCADFVTSRSFAPPPDGKVDSADLAFLLGSWGTCD